MDWPYKSPGMYLIEHLWDLMGVHIRDMDNPAAAQLRVAVKQAWVALRPVRGLALVWSMPRPVRAVLAVMIVSL